MNSFKDAAVIAAAGAIGVAYFGWPVLRAWRARAWPRAPGHVTRTHIDEIKSPSNSWRTRYLLRVEYTYSVAGVTHTGNRRSFFASASKHKVRDYAVEEERNYPKGGTLEVRYDAAHVDESVLETTVPWPWYVALVVSAVFLLGGLWGLVRLAV